jgi:hypothetical protein
MKKIIVALAAAAVSLLIASPALAAPVSAPFTFGGLTWCPSYQQEYGCDSSQHPGNYSVSFAPGQVSQDSSGNVDLSMNYADGESGAFNTQGNETWDETTKGTVYETITLPCNSSGQIENWPAFWMDGTTGSWPAHGEIDIAEGLGGTVQWHYHYLNAAGQSASVGGTYPVSGCGSHRYGVDREASQILYYMDGTLYGTVTASEIGVPLATDPMYVINDYGACSLSWCGPTVDGAQMTVSDFWGAS